MTAVLVAPTHPPVRRHHCAAGVTPCGDPARFYPDGWRCTGHCRNPELTATVPFMARLKAVA